ncbi:hypothetical protein VTJ04DRAFT_3318 [Mycothermus thermophilus]|uniref:uncharacterized protein n=1 Tax=Humicola insolens TaxID=85995 RepID=UPI0037435564
MKVQAFGIACLLGGVIAAPVPEETQNMDMQMMRQGMEHMMTPEQMAQMMPQGMDHMMMPHMRNNMAMPMNDDSEVKHPIQDSDGDNNEPESMMTFEEMVNEVQAQVRVIQNLMQQTKDPNAMMEGIMMPMMEIDQALKMGVSRILDLGGLLDGLTDIVNGGDATANDTTTAGQGKPTKGRPGKGGKHNPLNLVRDLLKSVCDLLENLLTGGLIGNLVDNVLGGLLGAVGNTVGGVTGGAIGGRVSAQAGLEATGAEELIQEILKSVGQILPLAADAVATGTAAGHAAGWTHP